MRTSVRLVCLGFLLSGCATQPDAVVGTYVSPTTYSSYSCKQLVSERNRVVQKVNELNGVQKKKADNDAAAMGVGLILFWPALLVMAGGNDVEPELAAMKGNYDALTAAGIQKGCF
jgi:hypothetical protein